MAHNLAETSLAGVHEKILLYGDPGTGKTHVAGSMPPPIYFLVIGGENELKTLKGKSFKEMHGEPLIYFDNASEEFGKRGTFSGATAFDIACDLLDAALAADADGSMIFNSIVIENATTLVESQMYKAIEINYSLATTTGKTAMDRLAKHGIIKPGDNDWGSAQSLMTKFVSWLRQIDKHICFVAHARTQMNTKRGGQETLLSIKPEFIGKHRTQIPRDFDNVWYQTMSGGGRGLVGKTQTVRDEFILAKTRVGGILAPTLTNLNMTKAIAKLAAADV